MFTVECDIYGCRNMEDHSTPPITAVVDGETVTLDLCDEHLAYFKATPPEQYSIGRTFTGEIEVRKIPAPREQPLPE